MTYDWVGIVLAAVICGGIPLAGLAYYLYDNLHGHKIPSGDDGRS